MSPRSFGCVVYYQRALAGLLLLAFSPPILVQAQSYYDPPYAISTLAGTTVAVGSSDGTGASAQFYNPTAVAMDASGNTYVADSNNQTIRMVAPDGVVTTIAGAAGVTGSADGMGSAARFKNPHGVAVDAAGNVYVADTSNNTIRKIASGGVVTTLAGTAGTTGTADGTGAAARFNAPYGIAVSASGDAIYVADSNNHTIRKIVPTGVVTTLAGAAGTPGTADGSGTAAQFRTPRGLAVDAAGYVYVCDTGNHTIRKIALDAGVVTLAGTAGAAGTADGLGTAASFNRPYGIAVDGSGNLYVGDSSNHAIRKISSAGDVTTLAGLAPAYGSMDGLGTAARFYAPAGVAIDSTGNLSVADSSNSTIRKVTSAGEVSTLAGTATYGSADGTGTAARFYSPQGVAVDSAGNLYVADTNNQIIRKISPAGEVTTLAGAAGMAGSADGTGSAARFYGPTAVALDTGGNLYVADAGSTIRKVSPGGDVATLAGAYFSNGSTDGTGAAARFNLPGGLAVDAAGNIFVTDSGNHTIRKVTPDGVVTTLAGQAGSAGLTNGTGAAARFSNPTGIVLDAAGNLYVADSGNRCIRKVTPAGVVTRVAGAANYYAGATDGVGLNAAFGTPSGLAIDGGGNLFVSDLNNQTIRRISANGVVTTLAGATLKSGSANGTGFAAGFNAPRGLAVDGSGSLYVADSLNNTIRKGVVATGEVPFAFGTLAGSAGNAGSTDGTGSGARFTHPAGVVMNASGDSFVTNGGTNIRKVTATGDVTTLAGSSSVGGTSDGVGSAARFSGLAGITLAPSGDFYVTDANTIRKVTSAGSVTTIVGTPGATGSADGTGGAAQFFGAYGIAADSTGNLYVADRFNSTIRKIAPGGIVTTFAGLALHTGTADGTGNGARFNEPTGLAIDAADNLYVADTGNYTVRKITPGGVVTTLAGQAGSSGFGDGPALTAQFSFIYGIAVDGTGNVYVADENNLIRKISTAGMVTTLAGTAGASGSDDGMESFVRFYLPDAIAVNPAGDILVVADTANNLIREGTPVTVAAPLFVHQPMDQVGLAYYGSSGGATFVAAASGLPAPALQWQRLPVGSSTWVNIVYDSNITNPSPGTLTLNLLTAAMRGDQFRCIATNATGSVTSNVATLTVYLVPGLTGGPLNQTVVAGTPAVFSVTAAGDPTPTLQWQGHDASIQTDWFNLVEGSVYSGVTTQTLTLNSPGIDLDGYQFRCVGTNPGATNYSGTALLRINYAPVFNSQPAGKTVASGASTYFIVSANGSPTPTYQWQRMASGSGSWIPLSNDTTYSGTSSNLLTISTTTGPMNGDQFRCVATNSVSSINSSAATLTVTGGAAVANDFNGDGKSDIILQNMVGGDRGFWLMNGTGIASWVDMGYVLPDWRIAATADFNGDGKPDFLWENTVTGDRGFWLMNGTAYASWVSMGYVSTDWRIAATADFSGDGKPDILWENTVTGDRGYWLMNGTAYSSWVDLGYVSTDWHIAAAADFNGDGKTDIVWENTVTGDRGFWLMNGTAYSSWVDLGYVSTDWRIAAAADFNGDGKADILWENAVTGDRGFWLMNGTTFGSWVDMGYVSTDWLIGN